MEKEVSIIIVNYNTEDLLENCIDSIYKNTVDVDFEIIIVDNNSSQSLQPLKELYPKVRLQILEENIGFGRANNIGAEIATGKYLFFLNPDTLLLNNAIHILYSYMQKNPDVGICGGNLYTENLQPASSYYKVDFLRLEYKIIFNGKHTIGFNHTKSPFPVDVIVGADLLIRKDLFISLNGFDKDFFMYFEEVELCDRVKKSGYKIISLPDANIIHLQGSSAENKNEELKKWSLQEHWFSKFVYFRKTKGKYKTFFLYISFMLKMKLAFIAYQIKKNETKIEYWILKKKVIQNAYNRYLNLFSENQPNNIS